MALTVEDGTGLAAADSYAALAEIRTWIENYLGATALATWDALTTAEQEVHARRGPMFLDGALRHRYKGLRANQGQGLEWPRDHVVLDDVDPPLCFPSSGAASIPEDLKRAQAAASYASASGIELFPSQSQIGGQDLESVKVDVIGVEFRVPLANAPAIGALRSIGGSGRFGGILARYLKAPTASPERG